MKKLLLILLGLISFNLYSQIEVGAAVSNNGTYEAEMNIMDSTIYGSKKTMFTLQKGISLTTYSINQNDYYWYNVVGDKPSGNNFYLGTIIRIGTGRQSVVTTDFGFGIGLAKSYDTEYTYDPNTGMEQMKYIDEGYISAIGMTWGINVKVMHNVDTYFRAGGLFKDYGDFAAVGFKYIIPVKR